MKPSTTVLVTGGTGAPGRHLAAPARGRVAGPGGCV